MITSQHLYHRTCPTYQSACQPSTSSSGTGGLGQINTNTTNTYVNPTAPIYYLAGNAGVPDSALV